MAEPNQPNKPSSELSTHSESTTQKPSRRDFMRTSSLLVAGGAVGGSLSIARSAHAQGSDLIKIGLVGCGGRGTGAAIQALNTTSGPIKLITIADVFPDKVQQTYRAAKGKHPDKVDIPKDRQFAGFDAYQKVLDTDIDLVILATAPGFRPLHFEAAVKAGKHVFMEKPVGTDAPGIRRVLAANAEAKKKNLAVAVGLQRHHESLYKEMIAKLQDGAIGDFITIRVYWNGGGVWTRPRQPQQTELEYQVRNWYYFNWLCGDHIVEQHIHNLDVGNWLMNGVPQRVNAQGGREVRKGEDHGQIFDHFFCEYTYENGTKMFSQCRHIRNCWNSVSEHVHGTKGFADITGGKIYDSSGELVFKSDGKRGGHQQEHHDLFDALRAGKLPNEGDYGATSTMTSIFGRLAAYSGKQLEWNDAINSNIALADTDTLLKLSDPAPVSPDADGLYPVAVPGVTKTV